MVYVDLYHKSRFVSSFTLPSVFSGIRKCMIRFGRRACGGGNGVVFECDVLGGLGVAKCAVKVLKQQDDIRRDRFNNEVRIQAALNHPRISKFFDNGEFAIDGFDIPWMAMELGGENLRSHVQKRGPLETPALIQACQDICEALGHLHEQDMIHRDVKPDNFVLDLTATGHVKMIDFGIAKYIGEDISARPLDQLTQHLEFVGPVFYSSPELVAYARDKRHPVDHRSDLFQAAKVIWFLATGNVTAGVPSRKSCPFGGKLRDALLDTLSDDPEDRPASAQELWKLLQPAWN